MSDLDVFTLCDLMVLHKSATRQTLNAAIRFRDAGSSRAVLSAYIGEIDEHRERLFLEITRRQREEAAGR